MGLGAGEGLGFQVWGTMLRLFILAGRGGGGGQKYWDILGHARIGAVGKLHKCEYRYLKAAGERVCMFRAHLEVHGTYSLKRTVLITHL